MWPRKWAPLLSVEMTWSSTHLSALSRTILYNLKYLPKIFSLISSILHRSKGTKLSCNHSLQHLHPQSYPWKCSSPDWAGLGATWSRARGLELDCLGGHPSRTIPGFHECISSVLLKQNLFNHCGCLHGFYYCSTVHVFLHHSTGR